MDGLNGIDDDFLQYIAKLQALDVKCERIPRSDLIKMSYKGHVEFLLDNELPYIPIGYKNIIRDHFFSKQLLSAKGIPVLEGVVFDKHQLAQALDYAENTLGWPVVIRSTNKRCGGGVYCGIQSALEFTTTWQRYVLPEANHYSVIETCWTFCPVYCFIVFKEGDPVVVKRTVPILMGDGKHTINQLVNSINQQRGLDGHVGLNKIIISDQDGRRCLAAQGLSPQSILIKGEVINLRFTSNVKYGGLSETIDNHFIHPTYWPLLDSIWALFPELPYLSVSLLIWDITKPANRDNAAVKSLHTTSNVAMHLPRLLNMIFPEVESS